MLATVTDVEARLGRPLTQQELLRVDVLISDAQHLVISYTGSDFSGDVPAAVTSVVARMVARVIGAPVDNATVESQTQSTGPYSQTIKYVPDALGGPWLSATDRLILRPYRSGARSIAVVSERS